MGEHWRYGRIRRLRRRSWPRRFVVLIFLGWLHCFRVHSARLDLVEMAESVGISQVVDYAAA